MRITTVSLLTAGLLAASLSGCSSSDDKTETAATKDASVSASASEAGGPEESESETSDSSESSDSSDSASGDLCKSFSPKKLDALDGMKEIDAKMAEQLTSQSAKSGMKFVESKAYSDDAGELMYMCGVVDSKLSFAELKKETTKLSEEQKESMQQLLGKDISLEYKEISGVAGGEGLLTHVGMKVQGKSAVVDYILFPQGDKLGAVMHAKQISGDASKEDLAKIDVAPLKEIANTLTK